MRENAILQPRDATAVTCDPQTPIAAGAQGGNPTVLQLRRRWLVHRREPNSVKTCQPFMCSHPKVAVAGLRYGVNRVLRQSVVRLPDAHAIRDDSVPKGGPSKLRLRKQR